MLVLGIESSTMQGGVALVGETGLVAEYTLNVEVTHSERLLPALDRLLTDAGVGLEALGGLAVSIGPGSFTGLRIGLSTAKGLAAATGKPLIISTGMATIAEIDEAVAFYSTLFQTEPAKRRDGYANFAVDSPPLKLVLIENPEAAGRLNHLGVEVADTGTVAAEQELRYVLANSASRLLVASADLRSAAAAVAEASEDIESVVLVDDSYESLLTGAGSERIEVVRVFQKALSQGQIPFIARALVG